MDNTDHNGLLKKDIPAFFGLPYISLKNVPIKLSPRNEEMLAYRPAELEKFIANEILRLGIKISQREQKLIKHALKIDVKIGEGSNSCQIEVDFDHMPEEVKRILIDSNLL